MPGASHGPLPQVIQSRIADFRLFVSSDLALDAPFFTWVGGVNEGDVENDSHAPYRQ